MNAQIASFTNQVTYGLVVNETTGQATDCGCKDRQYRHRECKHMKAFNVEIDRAATFLLLMRKVSDQEATNRLNREMATDSRFA